MSTYTKTLLFFAALVVMSYWPVFLGRVPLATDVIMQFPPFVLHYYSMTVTAPHAELGDPVTAVYPWRKFASEAIRRGVLPLWNPDLLAGTPFQANSLTAVFYPLNWIFLFLPMPAAWSLSMMLKVFLSAAFTFLFLREIGAAVSGAIVGATAFAFSGPMVAWLAWPRGDTSIWLPLLCFQIHRLCRQPCRRHAIALAAVLAMAILSGHPPMAARVVATGAVYWVWVVVSQRYQDYRRQLLWVSVGGCLALGLAAVQVAPSVEWLRYIYRSLEMRRFGLDLFQAIGFFSRDMSRQPNSAGVFIPQGAVYIGALTLLAAVFAVFRQAKKDVTFFSILFGLSVCIAYEVSPIFDVVQKSPIFGALGMDETLMFADFSLAVLAGLGISYLEAFEWDGSTKKVLAGSVAVLLTAVAAFHMGAAVLSRMTTPDVAWWRSPRSFRVLLIVSAVVIALRLFQMLSSRQWTVVVTLLIAADLVSYSYGYTPFNRPETIYPNVPLFEFLSRQSKPFRVVALDSAVSVNAEYVYGLSTAGGYEYMQKRMSSLGERLLKKSTNGFDLGFTSQGIINAKNRVVDLLNIRYVVATNLNQSESLIRSAPDRFRQIWSEEHTSLFENQNVLPRAFLVPQTNIEVIPDDEAQLARLNESSFDPAARVILPGFPAGARGGEQSGGTQQLVNYNEGLNWVRVQLNAMTPSVLVLSQIHYPGWRVYVDGKPAPLLRPDYAFTGTAVGAGSHTVEFRFLPTSFIAGAIISVLSLLVAVVGYWKAK